MELFTENAIKYQEENVKRQRVLKQSADRQRVQMELQQKNEDARKSCKTLEKPQASPAPNIISQNEDGPFKKCAIRHVQLLKRPSWA